MNIIKSELVFNLWAIFDGSAQFVYALSGKAYNLSGTDEEKLNMLRHLSLTDYRTAKRFKVPDRFTMNFVNGESMSGVTAVATIHNKDAQLFEEVFHLVVNDLPPVLVFDESGHREQKQVIPEDPLCITTILHENDVGEIRSIVSEEDREWFWKRTKNNIEEIV